MIRWRLKSELFMNLVTGYCASYSSFTENKTRYIEYYRETKAEKSDPLQTRQQLFSRENLFRHNLMPLFTVTVAGSQPGVGLVWAASGTAARCNPKRRCGKRRITATRGTGTPGTRRRREALRSTGTAPTPLSALSSAISSPLPPASSCSAVATLVPPLSLFPLSFVIYLFNWRIWGLALAGIGYKTVTL